ncbi:MAG: cell division protein FtsQ [Flavobacteriaceae bacterium]|nr:cell division protein FtsQ [Flavobacteriaceae bacterium]
MIKYKTHIKTLFFTLLITSLFVFVNHRNSVRKIKDIQIEFEQGDNLFITSEMVNKLLTQSTNNLKNKAKESINLKDLEQNILTSKMIENVEVYLTVDAVLKTRVLQRKPIARVQANNGSYYLDSKGKKMPLSINHSARVPIVTGVKSANDLKLVFKMCNTVLKEAFMHKQIIGLKISNNEFELKTRMGNQVILFGDLTKTNFKIKKLKAFYQKVIADKTLKNYKKINLKYNDQVVCTKKING